MAKKTVTAWVGVADNKYVRVVSHLRRLTLQNLKDYYGGEDYNRLVFSGYLTVKKATVTWEDK